MAGVPPLPDGAWVQGVIVNGLFVYTRMVAGELHWQVCTGREVLAHGVLPVHQARWEDREAALNRTTQRLARDYADPFREVAATSPAPRRGRATKGR